MSRQRSLNKILNGNFLTFILCLENLPLHSFPNVLLVGKFLVKLSLLDLGEQLTFDLGIRQGSTRCWLERLFHWILISIYKEWVFIIVNKLRKYSLINFTEKTTSWLSQTRPLIKFNTFLQVKYDKEVFISSGYIKIMFVYIIKLSINKLYALTYRLFDTQITNK